METLIEIPRDRWIEARDSFKARWPQGVPGYYAMQSLIDHPDMINDFYLRVYCPYNVLTDGIVAFVNKGHEKEDYILLNNEDTKTIEKAILNSKLIDWNQNLRISEGDNDVLEVVKRIIEEKNLKIVDVGPTIKHFYPKHKKPFAFQPNGTYVAEIKLEHIPNVDKVWPHRYATSPRFFEVLIKNGLSYGLLSSENDELLSWIFISEVGYFTHLYCDGKHRKLGYAEFIAKYVTNKELEKGKDVFCYIIEENSGSLKLFRKLNFHVIGRGVWVCLVKNYEMSKL